MRKTIIILTIIVLVLLIVLLLVNRFVNQFSQKPGENPNLPTGIILPKSELSAEKLDIVKIDPQDQAFNVALDKKITITFTRPFTQDEVIFNLTPNTPHTTMIEDNTLIVTPDTNWETGTLYTYFFNFAADDEQVRLYRFTTTGPTQEFLPDTQTEGLYEDVVNEQKTRHPDTYVANNTPYESATFSVRTEFDPNPPAHNFFIINAKIDNEDQVKQDVNAWLQQLDLSNEQIQSLDIRYE